MAGEDCSVVFKARPSCVHQTCELSQALISILADFFRCDPICYQSRIPKAPASPILLLLSEIMTADQVQRLRESFSRIEQQADIAALVFYREVFTLAPELRPMFNTSIELQGRKLMDSLRHTVATLEKPAELVPVLEALGRRHLTYGTKEEHYPIIAKAMMRMLAEVLGKQFTAETATAWDQALKFVVATMQRGARESAKHDADA